MLKLDNSLQVIAGEDYSRPLPILKMKLEPPPPSEQVISRPHLVERLDQGLHKALTLVHAPAGYGKSTLVQQWLERPGLSPVAWLRLDGDDNELKRFVTYLVAAVQKVFPTSCQRTRSLLLLSPGIPMPWFASVLLNELGNLPGPLLLVLEEYESIRSEAIHCLLRQLVAYQPPTLHLIVVTRVKPPFSLARLRQRRLVNEIGADDLRLTIEETAAVLEQAFGGVVGSEEAAALHVQTEGWVSGLHLANRTHYREQFLHEFFIDEVLADQPPDVQEFLLESSLLDRFCPALMAGVSQMTPSVAAVERMVQRLQRASLFVHRVDSPGGWYRYHCLFRNALRLELAQQRGEEEIADLHRRAAVWFEKEGAIELALSHLLAAGEQQAAVDLIESQVMAALAREQFPALAGWLQRLPATLIRQRPALLLADAWVRQARTFLPDIEAQLSLVEDLLDGGNGAFDATMAAGAAALCSNLWYWRGDPARSYTAVQHVCERTDGMDTFMGAYALARLALSRQMAGAIQSALQELDASLQQGLAAGAQAQLLRARALLCLRGGRLGEAERSAKALQRLSEENGLLANASWAHYLLGRVYYEWNRLEEATHHFSAVVGAPDAAASLPLHDSHIGLALIYEIRGEHELADELVAGIQTRFLERGALFLSTTGSFEAHLALRRANMNAATRLMAQRASAPEAESLLLLEAPALTRIRILIAQNTATSLQEALGAVRALQRVTQNTYNRLRHVEVLSLLALVLEAQGERETALDVLQQAVAVAERGGMIRIFIDLGPRMAALLYRLATGYSDNPYVRHILTSFPRRPQPAMLVPEDEWADLLQPLTDREWEVLGLVGQRLSNKEIAHNLTISPHTVKKHVSNIYQKLNVNSRRQAVARAHQLGVLSTPAEGAPFLAFG